MKKIFLLILLLPFLFVCSSRRIDYNVPAGSRSRVYSGLENFINNYSDEYRGKKGVLVTNHSGVDFNLRKNITLLREKGIEIATVFAPEHGIHGYQNEFDSSLYSIDRDYRIIIYNLHHLKTKTLGHIIKYADVVFFDIQDMGMRCYTYISNLKMLMDTLQGTSTELVVLDRPNPLGFLGVDGPYLEKQFATKFISAFPSTFIYDMTIGEAARYYNGEYRKGVKLKVIPLKGYGRDMLYNETMLPWVPPSPNLPTYESSIVYSAVVLLEGVNISLGRGTTKPFEYLGAPWIEPVSFCRGLRELGLENFKFRPVYFEPTFSKYKGQVCGGVQIFYVGGRISPTEVSFKLISHIKTHYSRLRWEKFRRYYDIDYLAGTDELRKAIDDGKSWEDFRKSIQPGIEKYDDIREKYLIY